MIGVPLDVSVRAGRTGARLATAFGTDGTSENPQRVSPVRPYAHSQPTS
jgi:hypothetical protein